MNRKIVAFAIAFVLGIYAIAPIAIAAQPNPTRSIPVSGTNAAGQVFTGTLDIVRFAVKDGAIVAVGNLSGTLRSATGEVIRQITNQIVNIPLTARNATCEILHLELGPVDLNLLGLVIHLDRIVLDITAQSGPGNLLGNLLCAIAKLLDSNAAPTAIVNMLNKILGTLV